MGCENIAIVEHAPVREGDVLAQKYRVDRVLGVGGMGVVVAATHLQLDQRVALKFMLPEAFKNQEALARFQREARAAVKLKSEHVARVLDTGTFDNNSPYIVMEYLEGTDLAGELEQRGTLPVSDVAEYIVQACDALAEAHVLGIVHRDLKPANLFLTRRGDRTPLVKVLDFGISKANSLTEGGLGMTKTASMMGSPLYMSPEQMKSAKDVDARTDVWSLGIIMYELLGGRVPFNSDTLGALMSMVMMEQPAPLQLTRPDVPRGLSELVAHCLEKDPARRTRSVAEIALGLRPFAPSRSHPIIDRIASVLGATAPTSGVSSVASTHLAPVSQVASVQTAPGWGVTGPTPAGVPKPSRAPLIAGILVAMLGLLGVGIFGVSRFVKGATARTAATVEPVNAVTMTPAAPTTAPSQAATTEPTLTATPHATTTPTPVLASHTPPRVASAASSAKAVPPPPTVVTSAATATVRKPGLLDTSE
jgi:serine/threonine protein kinase